MSKPSIQYRTYLEVSKKLHFLERLQSRSLTDLPFPPIFILGAPRSGTTLFYQALLSEFEFSFLSNRHCRFFGMPWFVEKFFDYKTEFKKNVSFKSSFGNTKGWYSPSECGEFWYRFFQRNVTNPREASRNPESLNRFRNSLLALHKFSERPFVFKNLMNVLRLHQIIDVLPESLFIVINRKEISTAHSLLEARFSFHSNYDDWFSLKPPNIETLKKLPAHKQVIEQIRSTYALIDEVRAIAPDQFIDICYEEFCSNPSSSMSFLTDFLESHGIAQKPKNNLPDQFQIRDEIRIDPELYKKLKESITENIT